MPAGALFLNLTSFDVEAKGRSIEDAAMTEKRNPGKGRWVSDYVGCWPAVGLGGGAATSGASRTRVSTTILFI